MSELKVSSKEKGLKKVKNKQKYRLVVQILFFVTVLTIATGKVLSGLGIQIPTAISASLHAICPFGGVVAIYEYLSSGTMLQKLHESSFVMTIIMIISAIMIGPVFCGWVCPLGSIQEWFGKIGKRLFKKKYNKIIPKGIDKILRYTRYLVLALVIYNTAITSKLVFQDYDPYYALFNFWTNEVAITSYIILIVTLLLSLLIERPWCKYACPYGAFLGLSNFVRVFKIKRNATTCVNCKACDRECPMNIEVSKVKTVRNHQCISCLKCTSESSCPVDNTINLICGGNKNEN